MLKCKCLKSTRRLLDIYMYPDVLTRVIGTPVFDPSSQPCFFFIFVFFTGIICPPPPPRTVRHLGLKEPQKLRVKIEDNMQL